MAEKVGKATKEKTKAGRTVYITDKDIKDKKGNIFIKKGSRVSEISSTVGPIKGKYYNIPSIHAGKRYEDNELVEAIKNNRLIPTSVHDSIPEAEAAAKKRSNELNKGGDVSDQTKKAFSSNPFKGKQTVKRLKNVARNVPVLGTAFDVADIASSVATGNLGQAAVDTGLALAGTTPVGRVLSKTIKKSLNKARSKFKDKFKIDNPDDIYDPTDKKIKSYGQMYADEVKKDTKEKIKKKELKPEQLEDYVNTHGNLYKITGFIKGQESIPFHPLELINAKGVKGEHKYRDNSPQLFNLKERIKKEGYKPDPIHVIIDERGRPFVMEGNHRLAEAIQSGRNRIDVELQYLRGGENVDGPFSPKNLGLKSEMAKGGAMLNQQMEMAFMQDGGLQDEGGTVDKESGNDVPSGSLKKEVRDDVPAMLSEGEFVIPADVVRYIGLEKLMQMRQEAKMGLQMMEKMGQMGNSEEAEIPDDLPFGVTDIVVMGSDDDDEKEMAQGGVIYAQQGTDVPQQTDFEQMMGYEAGQGSNPYARKGPFIYENDKGETAMVYHDYMNRPMDVPIGYKIREDQGEDTPAPSPDPTPDDGESAIEARREEKRKERRQKEKADLRIQQAEDAMQTSAERVFPNLTPEEARSKYEELTLSQRIKLIPQEIKVMTGSDVSSEVVEDIINNPNKNKGKGGPLEVVENFVTDLVSGILKPFGIDINKTPDVKTVVKEEGNAINASDVSNNDIKFDEEPSFVQGMKDADRVAGKPPITLPQGIPSNMYEGQDAYEVGKSLANLSASDINTVMEQSRRQQGQTASPKQFGQTPVGSLPSAQFGQTPVGSLPSAQFGQTPVGSLPSAQFGQTPVGSLPSAQFGQTPVGSLPLSTNEQTGNVFGLGSGIDPAYTQSTFDVDGFKKRQAQRQADFDAQVKEINEGLKILEGTTLSSGDRKKTSTRKLKIDAKQGTGAFADRQRKEKDRDKRRKRQDAKKAADKRVKDYKEGKQTFRGRGGRAQGGLMKKDYP